MLHIDIPTLAEFKALASIKMSASFITKHQIHWTAPCASAMMSINI